MANQWTVNGRYISIDDEAARWRFTIDYRVTKKVTAGIEYSPGSDEVLPRATWFITPATRDLPSVTLGFTADRLSTPEGYAVFLTFGKTVPNTTFSPFVSLKYSTEDKTFAVPFGGNVMLGDKLTLQGLYDGNDTHGILTYHGREANYSFILARMKYPGIQVSVGF